MYRAPVTQSKFYSLLMMTCKDRIRLGPFEEYSACLYDADQEIEECFRNAGKSLTLQLACAVSAASIYERCDESLDRRIAAEGAETFVAVTVIIAGVAVVIYVAPGVVPWLVGLGGIPRPPILAI